MGLGGREILVEEIIIVRVAVVDVFAVRADFRGALDAGQLPGGVQSTISWQPAVRAGMASISTVENRGAVPPGM